MKKGELDTIDSKPKRTMLTKRGSFRYVSPTELKGIRRARYDYLVK